MKKDVGGCVLFGSQKYASAMQTYRSKILPYIKDCHQAYRYDPYAWPFCQKDSKLQFDDVKAFVKALNELALGPYTLDQSTYECVSMIHPLNETNFLLVVYAYMKTAYILGLVGAIYFN